MKLLEQRPPCRPRGRVIPLDLTASNPVKSFAAGLPQDVTRRWTSSNEVGLNTTGAYMGPCPGHQAGLRDLAMVRAAAVSGSEIALVAVAVLGLGPLHLGHHPTPGVVGALLDHVVGDSNKYQNYVKAAAAHDALVKHAGGLIVVLLEDLSVPRPC